MTLKNGKYYCDMCKDTEPIPKGKGFSFPSNPTGIDHAHQSCYASGVTNAGKVLGMNDKQIADRLYYDSKMANEYNERVSQ